MRQQHQQQQTNKQTRITWLSCVTRYASNNRLMVDNDRFLLICKMSGHMFLLTIHITVQIKVKKNTNKVAHSRS